ncbi:hypothetical protein [Streptomyces sp. CoH27]|uniref:hypothetical protein n=1 Tax=Streptomyces sp. CoH27 TaxID=2875763 RepID=UPI001CD3B052|nr:hypothetical protein [Streptomyces sp. CoH27]
MRVVGVDIGSVKQSNFAWAAVDSPERPVVSCGNDPEGAVQALVRSLNEDGRAVLAVEAPMAIPVPAPHGDEWQWLGRARTGEGNRAWSAGAGAGALATGIAQTAWMLSRLHALAPQTAVTTQPERFTAGQAYLLLTEAFVSATGKPVPVAAGQHAADAEAAARATLAYLTRGPESFPQVTCAPRRSFNLLAAIATWAGLPGPDDELRQDVLVIRTQPTT